MADQVEVTVVESDPVVVIVEAVESEASTVVVVQEEGTGVPGAGGPSRTTLLNITQQSPSGTAFFVNSGSTHYTFEGDIGNLGPSAQGYLDNEAIQLYLRGGKLLKKEHTEWTSEFSFILYMPVDIGDYIEILS